MMNEFRAETETPTEWVIGRDVFEMENTPLVEEAPVEAPKEEQMFHVFELAGLGKAPFRFVTVHSLPSKSLAEHNPSAYNYAMSLMPRGLALGMCQYCGHDLINNYEVKSADDKHFVVGCECIHKSGDKGLISAVKLDAKIKRAAKRAEKQAKEREIAMAQWEAERPQREAEEARQREIFNQNYDQAVAKNEWLNVVLRNKTGNFCESILSDLTGNRKNQVMPRRIESLPPRALAILNDIYSKTFGRMGSKAYDEASEDFESLVHG